MRRRRWIIAGIVVALIAAVSYSVYRYVRPLGVGDALTVYGPAARARLAPFFKRAGVAYPPKRVAILAFKQERRVAVWVAGANGRWRFLRDYGILAASGGSGPKLREGDYQVPEGLYRIEYLNPNSSYHLSMKVDYPNAADRAEAAVEHRTRLGGDIFIHGKDLSIGCIAIGDTAIEELFTLVAETGLRQTQVIIAPDDLRIVRAPADPRPWVVRLWQTIASALTAFPIELESNSAIGVSGMRKDAKVIAVKH